jgi:hypothetical protein
MQRTSTNVKAWCAVVMAIVVLVASGCATTTTMSSGTESSESPSAETTPSEATETESTPVSPPSTEGEEGESESESTSGEDEPGSASHEGDEKWCREHECEGEFDSEPGTVVECTDGTWSHAGGISGACSHHGGEA